MTEPTNTPQPPTASDSNLQDSPAVPGETVTAPRAVRRSRTRTALIAGGSVLAALILAGSGVAVGAAIADDFGDEEQDESSETVEGEAADASSVRYGAESAADVLAVIDAATAIAEGDVVGVDAAEDGTWEVQFLRGAGDETEVLVDASNNASIVSAEPADSDAGVPNGTLDRDTVEALVEAAFAEADGTIVEIEVDEDQVAPFDVSILTDDGRTVTVALDAAFTVVVTDNED